MEKNYLLHKWLNNEASKEELELLKTDPEYNTYLKIALASEDFDTPNSNHQANFKAISNRIKPVQKLKKQAIFSIAWKVAAIFTLALVSYYYTTTLNTSINTEIAQTQTFSLPDTSEVILNADSKITYNKKNWGQLRELSLDGEAYFKVTKGNKFSVKTTEGIVSVLGTQFNVFARDGLFIVACFEGLVSVTFNDSLIKVSAGNKIQVENGSLVFNEATDNKSPNWVASESSFENAPLSVVINELQRQYPIKVIVSTSSEKRFTGSFTHNNLEFALKSICEPLQLNYESNNKGEISIYAKRNK